MRKYLTILLAFLPLIVAAQIVQPVKWSGEENGDSVRMKAVIEPGWHMNIIEFAGQEWEMEFADSCIINVAKTDLTPIRFNACDDRMCTAPEVWEFESTDRSADRAQNTDTLLVGWGSTEGHLRAAANELGCDLAQFNYICPLPKNTHEVLSQYKRIIVCELNTGQFAAYLRSQFPDLPIEQYNEIQGQPFAVERIVRFAQQH